MDASATIRAYEQAVEYRRRFDSLYTEIARRIRPDENYFFSGDVNHGRKNRRDIFDPTAPLALQRFGSILESLISPSNKMWHKLVPMDRRMRKNKRVTDYLEEKTELLFSFRYAARSGFTAALQAVYEDLGAFGTGCVYVHDAGAGNIRYIPIPLYQIWIETDFFGDVVAVYRKFTLRPNEAISYFGKENLPSRIVEAAAGSRNMEFDFLHCVKKNDAYVAGRADALGMEYSSAYIAMDDKTVVSTSGYRSMPYIVARYMRAASERYGRSPAMFVLSGIHMANEISRTTIRVANKMADPPMLTAEEGVLRNFSANPGSFIYGGIDDSGKDRIKQLQINADLRAASDLNNEQRASINEAFLITLFEILVERPNMTATEAMLRAQEKGSLLAPTASQLQQELFANIIEREVDILAFHGAFDDAPTELLEANGEYKVEYDSYVNRLMRSDEAVGLLRTMEGLAPIAQVRPEVLDIFDPIEYGYTIAEINGAPSRVLRSREETAIRMDQRAQQEQAMQALDAAPVAASAAKDLAQAQAASRTGPQFNQGAASAATPT